MHQNESPSIDQDHAEALVEDVEFELTEQIRGVEKSHVLAHINRILGEIFTEPTMEKIGGEELVKLQLNENILRKLLISDNRIIASQKDKLVSKMNRALEATVDAGELFTSEKRESFASEVTRMIHDTVN